MFLFHVGQLCIFVFLFLILIIKFHVTFRFVEKAEHAVENYLRKEKDKISEVNFFRI